MIVHIVLLRFKPEISSDQVSQWMKDILTLKDKFPSILDIKTGENFSDRGKGYTHALVLCFESRQALEEYLPHPDHLKAAQPLRDASEDILAFDFEAS